MVSCVKQVVKKVAKITTGVTNLVDLGTVVRLKLVLNLLNPV